MGTSTAATPRARRVSSALRRSAGADEIVQTVLSDNDVRSSISEIAFRSPGFTTTFAIAYMIAEGTRAEGSREVIKRIAGPETVKQDLSSVLIELSKLIVQNQARTVAGSITDEIARRALLETVTTILRGSRHDLSATRDELSRNLENAVIKIGINGILSSFLGNYVAGLALLYTGREVAQILGTNKRLKKVRDKNNLEAEIREQSKIIGKHVIDRIARDVDLRNKPVHEVSLLAEKIPLILPTIISELKEEPP